MVLSVKSLKLRYSLFALLMVMSLISLWLGRATFIANNQQKAVKQILANEGSVRMSEEAPLNQFQKFIGEKFFQTVESVDFSTRRGRRTGTKEPKVSDDLLAQLEKLTDTKTVELGHNETVSDEQIEYLKSLKNLETLYLYRTEVKGPGLSDLAELPKLNYLDLNHTPLSDTGLQAASKCKQLRHLRLDNTKISDHGIAYLAELANLENLDINNTDITDNALIHLAKITSLKSVWLRGTKVTAEGIKKFSLSLPNCRVGSSFPLGKTADNTPLFPKGHKPSPEELKKKFKSLGIDGHVILEPNENDERAIGLFLSHTTLSEDVILDLIKTMPHLRDLIIRGSLVGDSFLEKLKEVETIEILEISDSKISDAGLPTFSTFASLRELYLHQNVISDQGLENFPLLYGIEILSFEGTKVTKHALEKLSKRLPGSVVDD